MRLDNVREFDSKESMILWIIDNYYSSYMFMFSRLEALNDKRLAEDIKKITKDYYSLVIEDGKYYLKNM